MIRQNPNLVYLVVLIPGTLGGLFLINSAHGDSEIASRERRAAGIIVGHQPSIHNRYEYRFRVEGRDYTGWETPLWKDPQVGDSVGVYFDPLDPTQNGVTDFAARSGRSLGQGIALLVLSGILGLAIFVVGATVARRHGRDRHTSSPPSILRD